MVVRETIAKIHQNLTNYPIAGVHLYKMKEEDIENVKGALEKQSFIELQKMEGLQKIELIQLFQRLKYFISL